MRSPLRLGASLGLALGLAAAAGCADPIPEAGREVVGALAQPLDARRRVVGARESEIGNLLADALLEAARRRDASTELALAAANAIRFDPIRTRSGVFPAGDVPRWVLETMLAQSELWIFDVSGRELRSVFERGVSAVPRPSYRFLVVSRGVEIRFDPSDQAQAVTPLLVGRSLLREGRRLRSVRIHGVELADAGTYRICAPDFVVRAMRGFIPLAEGPHTEAGSLADAAAAYLAAHSPVRPTVEGRLVSVAGD